MPRRSVNFLGDDLILRLPQVLEVDGVPIHFDADQELFWVPGRKLGVNAQAIYSKALADVKRKVVARATKVQILCIGQVHVFSGSMPSKPGMRHARVTGVESHTANNSYRGTTRERVWRFDDGQTGSVGSSHYRESDEATEKKLDEILADWRTYEQETYDRGRALAERWNEVVGGHPGPD